MLLNISSIDKTQDWKHFSFEDTCVGSVYNVNKLFETMLKLNTCRG